MIKIIDDSQFNAIVEDNNFITWEYIGLFKEGYMYLIEYYDKLEKVIVKKDF